MHKFSITDKLIIASISLSIITILIVASYSFYNARDAILDRTFNQLTSVRVYKTSLIENFFSNRSNEVQLAKASSDIQSLSREINKLQQSSDYVLSASEQIDLSNSFINEISKQHYNRIFIIGNNRNIIQLKPSQSPRPQTRLDYQALWDHTISNKSVQIEDFTRTDHLGQAIITLSSKISDDQHHVLGIIVFEISPNAIDSIMLEKEPSSGLGLSGESYLVGQDYLMRSSSRFQDNSFLNTAVQTEAVDSALADLPGTKIIKDYRGISVLSSYRKINIPNLDWVLLAEIDYDEVTIPIYRIRNEIVFISIFIFVIVLVVIVIISRKITYPIQRLNDAAREIGKGNLEVEIKHISNDEIGDLTKTFNTMALKLQSQNKELEIERKKSLRSLINGQEIERQRLSRELHDGLGQILIGLKLRYESCLSESELTNKNFDELGMLFDKTIEETRRISNNLMPAALVEFGLITAIRNLCNQISESSQINIQFNTFGDSVKLDQERKTYIYRIAQEALSNIVKHAKASHADIEITFNEDLVIFTITDDGSGFNESDMKQLNSNGLNNIKDRVSLLSGKFSLSSKIAKGTTIRIEIPLRTS